MQDAIHLFDFGGRMLETEIAVEPPGPGQPSGSVKPRVHLRYVDGFRGFAALYVVLNHAFLQTWPGNLYGAAFVPQGAVAFMTHWLDFGTSAVTFFIEISGFCLMLPVLAIRVRSDREGRAGFSITERVEYFLRIMRLFCFLSGSLPLSLAASLTVSTMHPCR